MLTVYFKNVGQGDSIILEWFRSGRKCIGIIDCNLYNNRNAIIDHLNSDPPKEIDFILLSHFHDDHFSGMPDLFDYLIENKIPVKYFYHTISPFIFHIYNTIDTSQKVQRSISRFYASHEKFLDHVEDAVAVSHHHRAIELNSDLELIFMAPNGSLYDMMARQLSRRVNKITTTREDINKLGTIISIKNKSNKSILLTSDAAKRSFQKIKGKITSELTLVQVPHHGSEKNLDETFWQGLVKMQNCPAMFSVGDEPKDKLPNDSTVNFFKKNGFDVFSTNKVYGINTHFGTSSTVSVPKSTHIVMSQFAKFRKTSVTSLSIVNKYSGEQRFQVL